MTAASSRRVAERHGDVAQPALVADAPDRAALHARVELLARPREELDERRVVEAVAHRGEIRLGRRLREAVPRAHELAVVAAIDAVADQRAQLLGDAPCELDGEVGDAAPRVELVGRDDRAGGADVDAARAGAAMSVAGGVAGSGRSV